MYPVLQPHVASNPRHDQNLFVFIPRLLSVTWSNPKMKHQHHQWCPDRSEPSDAAHLTWHYIPTCFLHQLWKGWVRWMCCWGATPTSPWQINLCPRSCLQKSKWLYVVAGVYNSSSDCRMIWQPNEHPSLCHNLSSLLLLPKFKSLIRAENHWLKHRSISTGFVSMWGNIFSGY